MLVTHTNPTGHFAFYAGGVALLLLVFLVVQIFLTRLYLIVELKRKKKVQLVWRKIIGEILAGESPELPKVKRSEVFYVLEEFDYVFGIIRGSEVDSLRKEFGKIIFPSPIKNYLKSFNVKKRLFALITLGHIRDEDSWDLIVELLVQTQPVLSLSAARSLVLINPERAMNEVIPAILQRNDIPWANIAHVLKLAGPKVVCRKLSGLIFDTLEMRQASLLRLYDVIQCEAEFSITTRILSRTVEDKVKSVCLNISQDPGIVFQARQYAHHDRWHVRMNAAVALGRFGKEEDIPLLTGLLKDSQWWVRYRAAQALVSMPFVDHGKIQQIRADLKDRYADDILVQVLNEFKYA